MKARINLTVEEEVLKKAKYYAEEHNTSVSEMVETYLKKITQKANKEKPYFLNVLENFKPKEDYNNRDLTKEYYEAKGKKYGY
jgi:hypothetical protein